MIAIGLTTTREELDRGSELLVQRTRAIDIASTEALYELFHLRPHYMRVHANSAATPDAEEGEDQVVVAGEEVQAQLHDPPCLIQVVVRLFDGADGRHLGKLGDRLRLEVQDDASGDVVDDERTVGDTGHGLEVLDDPTHGRLVVVRRHDQEAVDADRMCALGEMNGVLGGVRPRSGYDGRPVAHLVHRGLVELEPLRIRECRRLAGRPRDHQAVRAVLDQMGGERPEALEVDGPVRLEGSDDRCQDLALHRPDSTKRERQATKMVKEFKDFLLRGNLVELAVAFVMGLAFAALIASFVNDLILPIVAMIFGEPDFSGLTFTINDAVFRYGAFLTALITFVTTAAAIFFFVVKPVSAIMARMEKPTDEEVTDDERRHQELLAALERR